MSAPDAVTVLRAVDTAVLTKRICRTLDGEPLIDGYDNGFLFSVSEVPMSGLIDLGPLLARMERVPDRCIIRGRPLPGINRNRCRRLLYPVLDDDGQEIEPTFEPAARRWIALDFDDLPTPIWNPDDLARRRAAIERDRVEHGMPRPKGEDDGEDIDLAGDLDPAPIDPVADWPLICRAAVSPLPVEFHNASCWWSMTSSAGIKPGIRLRLWYWLDRAVTDQECKRWLADAPVDRALYSPVQIHYTASPIFDDPADDPVPLRSGWWWRHQNMVEVPELPEPEPVNVDQLAPVWKPIEIEPGRYREVAQACLDRRSLNDWEREFCAKVAGLDKLTKAQAETLATIADPMPARARRYADVALRAVAQASSGTRHPTLMAVAVRLYSLAGAGLLDHGDTTLKLLAAGEAPLSGAERLTRAMRIGGRPSELERACDWARARANASPDLPEGFRS